MDLDETFSRSEPPCPLLDPANPHTLCRRIDPELSICFTCKGQTHWKKKRYYYYCATCDLEFHRGCHFYAPEIRHPFHLLHPLHLILPLTIFTSSSSYFDISSFPNECASDSEEYSSDDGDYGSDENHQKCKCCREKLSRRQPYYHCSICNFSLHIPCSKNPPALTIENLKTHDHTLTLFPRQVPLPCDACGFSLDGAIVNPVYSCLLCNYMVHRRCIYLPRVIKITRHPHRISHACSLVPSGDELPCGVCRKPVDINYGNYSCNKGCHYAVHARCATKDEVWDGKDLEGVPEEEEQVIEPFLRIDEETIQHFSHDHHHLKIQGDENKGNHENMFCQACILPMTVSDRFYSCIQCEFVLHETCASLPRKKHHPIHKHPLTLFHPFSSNPPQELEAEYPSNGSFGCFGCGRWGSGFMYKCIDKDCFFRVDVRCASLPDPSIHDCHPHDHPFFFNWTRGECMCCKDIYKSTNTHIECIKCNTFLCVECATVPSLAHYKHDKHPLTLCCGEEETTYVVQYWCEICEGKLDATKWFYTCDSCRVTLHVTCLLGKDMYMKPNHFINYGSVKVEVARNSGNSRPRCNKCRVRCTDTLVYKSRGQVFCKPEHCKQDHL